MLNTFSFQDEFENEFWIQFVGEKPLYEPNSLCSFWYQIDLLVIVKL